MERTLWAKGAGGPQYLLRIGFPGPRRKAKGRSLTQPMIEALPLLLFLFQPN